MCYLIIGDNGSQYVFTDCFDRSVFFERPGTTPPILEEFPVRSSLSLMRQVETDIGNQIFSRINCMHSKCHSFPWKNMGTVLETI